MKFKISAETPCIKGLQHLFYFNNCQRRELFPLAYIKRRGHYRKERQGNKKSDKLSGCIRRYWKCKSVFGGNGAAAGGTGTAADRAYRETGWKGFSRKIMTR